RGDAPRRRARRRRAEALRAGTRRDGALLAVGSRPRRGGTQPEPAPVTMGARVTTDWLAANLGRRDLRVVDGSWHLPELQRGALPGWRAEGRPVESGLPAPRFRRYTARLHPSRVRDLAQMRANLRHGREQVVDARSHGRFVGTEPEPRPGLRAGHIPGSLNLPYDRLYAKDG